MQQKRVPFHLLLSPPPEALPTWETIVGNWSWVKYLIEGWDLFQNWGRVGTLEFAELALCELEDCLETLEGHVVTGIAGSLFIKIVENVIQEKERIIERFSEERQ